MKGGLPKPLLHRIAALEASQSAAATKKGGPVIPDLTDAQFPHQLAFLEDNSQLIAALCTRRAAKSFSAGKRLIRAMFKHPGCSVLFIGLTKESAKKIVWKDVLKVINRRWGLGARFSDTELTMTLPNGSVCYLTGADASADEMEKLLGQKYAEVVIDEAASYTIDLNRLVYGVLKPAVADYRGTICLVGTPSNLKSGLFFDLTQGQEPSVPGRWVEKGWSCHRWSTLQNPYMADNWKAEIEQLILDNPRIEETPLFQQHYLGRWVIDESLLVYRYQPGRNDFNGTLPAFGAGHWHFVLAIDLGFNDPSTFTVAAYHDLDRCLYFVHSHRLQWLDITDVSAEAEAMKKRWPVEMVVVDGANKQAVAELNNRHGLEAVAADKTGKADFIDIMNGEFIQERIKLSPDCAPLKEEYAGLIWDERKLLKRKREEHPGCKNNCTDSGLYAWRHCWQYLSVPETPKPDKYSPEHFQQQADAQQRQLDEHFEQQFEANKQAQMEQRENDGWT